MDIIKNDNISLKAKGLYFILDFYIKSNMKISKQILQQNSRDGVKGFESAWSELKDNGYLLVTKTNVNGTFIYDYILTR